MKKGFPDGKPFSPRWRRCGSVLFRVVVVALAGLVLGLCIGSGGGWEAETAQTISIQSAAAPPVPVFSETPRLNPKPESESRSSSVLQATSHYFAPYKPVDGVLTYLGQCVQRFFSLMDDKRMDGITATCNIPFVIISLTFEVRELGNIFCGLTDEAMDDERGSIFIGKLILIENGANVDLNKARAELEVIASANPTRIAVHRSPAFEGLAWAYNRGMSEIIRLAEKMGNEQYFALFMAPNANVTGKGADVKTPTGDVLLEQSCKDFSRHVYEQARHADVFRAASVARDGERSVGDTPLVSQVALEGSPKDEYTIGVAPRRWKADGEWKTLFQDVYMSLGPPRSILDLPAAARVSMGVLPALVDDYRTFYLSRWGMELIGSFDENFFTVSAAKAMVADWSMRSHILGLNVSTVAEKCFRDKRERAEYPYPDRLGRGAYWAYIWSNKYNETQAANQYLATKWGYSIASRDPANQDGGYVHPYNTASLSADMWVLDRHRLAVMRDQGEFPENKNPTVPSYNLEWSRGGK